MEKVTRTETAAILPPAGSHQHTPSVFCSDFVNALAGRCGILAGISAGGNGKSLDLDIISTGIVLTVNDGGLAACVNHYIILGFVVGILDVFNVLRLVLGSLYGSSGRGRGRLFGRGGGGGRCGCG